VLDVAGRLPQVSPPVLSISPFTHVPNALICEVFVVPLVWLLGAAVLTAAGLVEL
jgi:hypothetical protein